MDTHVQHEGGTRAVGLVSFYRDVSARVYVPLVVLGLVLAGAAIGEAGYALAISNPLGPVWLVGFLVGLPFIGGITYAGYWLPRSSITPPRYHRVLLWCVGASGLFGLLNVSLMVVEPPSSLLVTVAWSRWAMTLGAAAGVTIGVFEARGIERAVEAERTRVRAEEAEAREQLLTHLNALLQHEVVNTTTVIRGNADLIADRAEDAAVADRTATIVTQTEEMHDVVDDVRVLLDAFDDEAPLESVDVTKLLADEIERVRETYEDLQVEASLPPAATVHANHALRRAFANLLTNAVDHDDSGDPTVTVTVERTPETVTVRIADAGPGIPPAERETLFARDDRYDPDHSMGLPLSQTLVERFGGSIELVETGPDGTTFRVDLPRADGEEHE